MDWNTQASLSITNSQSLLKLMSIALVTPSNHLILCRLLLLLPSIFPSITVFSNESVLRIRWPEYWSFSFSISPSNEHPGLISFRMDWLGLPAVQGTLKSLLQHHSSKAPILWHSAFFMVQLSNPYMTTGKTIALTRQTFVSKVMSLLFNMLSRLVITFFPRSSGILPVSWKLEDSVSFLLGQMACAWLRGEHREVGRVSWLCLSGGPVPSKGTLSGLSTSSPACSWWRLGEKSLQMSADCPVVQVFQPYKFITNPK